MRRLPSASLLACCFALSACSPAAVAPDAAVPPGDAAGLEGSAPVDAGVPEDGAASDVPRVIRNRDAGPPPADIDGFLAYQMRIGGIKGLAAAILKDGRIARTFTRGMATDSAPVDEHSLFVAASVSKTFVGALVLQLVEQGRLDLDAPLDPILGFSLRHPSFPDRAITTRMLLTHTSGLTDDFVALAAFVVPEADPAMPLRDVVTGYIASPSHFGAEPGTAYSYANIAFAVLGLIAETVSGTDLRTLSRTRLFEPLALDGAGWFYADLDAAHIADEYSYDAFTDAYTVQPRNNYWHYPATSLRISITGMSRWLLGHIQNGTLDGARFLSMASIEAERTAAIPRIRSSQNLVWYYSTEGGKRWLGHSGSSFGASNQVLYDPASGRGIIVLTNSDAYIRSRFGQPAGSDAIDAIVRRLDQEANAL